MQNAQATAPREWLEQLNIGAPPVPGQQIEFGSISREILPNSPSSAPLPDFAKN
jgi:hypothetical protein